MKKILTIAGSDSSGGAGIQADIKTITAHKMYAMSVITSLTAQNTTGVFGILNTPSEFTAQQIDCIFSDIRPDAIKIGMLSTSENILAVSERLKYYNAENIVIDPVMISTSGHALISDNAKEFLINELFPLATLITPNIPEAECLSDMKINNFSDAIISANYIYKRFQTNILLKGGHGSSKADDILIYQGNQVIIHGNIINSDNTHGTGCTLSSAIACNLALGYPLETCIKNSKKYLENAMNTGLNLGKGNGPLNHCAEFN
ncbi:MAG: bifunctional hydroxymethylpyrimidine kinase/phosphomethylpyrimidine kinase [Oscillospiraceae bacterium]|nr:bifunctional hydroxymethylpyrimidine kinase/phosphomethylpyrimidine kinase [Oscillospiraceae bacterium]